MLIKSNNNNDDNKPRANKYAEAQSFLGSFYLSSKPKPNRSRSPSRSRGRSWRRVRGFLWGLASADRATGDSNKRRPLFVPHVPHCHSHAQTESDIEREREKQTRTHMHEHATGAKLFEKCWAACDASRKLFCFLFFFIVYRATSANRRVWQAISDTDYDCDFDTVYVYRVRACERVFDLCRTFRNTSVCVCTWMCPEWNKIGATGKLIIDCHFYRWRSLC